MRTDTSARWLATSAILALGATAGALSTAGPSSYRREETAKVLLANKAIDVPVMNTVFLADRTAKLSGGPPSVADQRLLASFLYGDDAGHGALSLFAIGLSIVTVVLALGSARRSNRAKGADTALSPPSSPP